MAKLEQCPRSSSTRPIDMLQRHLRHGALIHDKCDAPKLEVTSNGNPPSPRETTRDHPLEAYYDFPQLGRIGQEFELMP